MADLSGPPPSHSVAVDDASAGRADTGREALRSGRSGLSRDAGRLCGHHLSSIPGDEVERQWNSRYIRLR